MTEYIVGTYERGVFIPLEREIYCAMHAQAVLLRYRRQWGNVTFEVREVRDD
jgi:hypothetical protein